MPAHTRTTETGTPQDTPTASPLRIVFSLLHAGYLRHYAEPVRILVGRGHAVHLALHREGPKDRGDDRLLARLLEDCPSVTVGAAPRRNHLDGWRAIAWVVRSLADSVRYADPRYGEAVALRVRAAERVRDRVDAGKIDPVSRRLVLRCLEWTQRVRDPHRVRHALRLLSALEAAIPPARRTTALIRAHRANVVLASPVVDFGSDQVEFVKSAKALRIPSAVCIASWDNLTNKGLLRVAPDRVLVWNARQRDELVEMHGISPDRVVLTGGQKFDPWFALEPATDREGFAARVGLDPAHPYLLYVCSSTFVAPDEVEAVRRWIAAVREDHELRPLGILVRPHPQNAGQWQHEDLSDLDNVVVWPRHGEYPDEGAARSGFFDSIHHSAAVVGVNTSAQIEAAIIGRPVFTLLTPEFAETQVGTLHFQYLRRENGGVVHEAATLDEHRAQLRSALAPGAREPRTFVESFVRPRVLDVPVAPIVADEIEALARIDTHEPDRMPAQARRLLLRGALTPLALTASAVATGVSLASALERVRRRPA